MNTDTDDRLLLSRADAARLLGIGTTKLDDLIARRLIRTKRIGRRVLVPRAAVEEFVTGDGPR